MSKHDPLAIREKIAAKHAEAEAIVALAESEDRELTEQDHTQFDALLADIGKEDGSDSTGLYRDLVRAEKLESLRLEMKTPAKAQSQELAAPEKPEYNIRALGWQNVGSLKAFKGPKAEQHAYEAGMWIKAAILKDRHAADWCRDNLVGFRAAQTEGTDSQGGYTVPDPLSDAVLEARDAVGVTPRISDRFPMTSDTLKIPTIVSGQTVQYPGEAAAISLSDVVWGQVALTAVKRAVLTKISWELINDSIVNMADRVAARAGYELGARMDVELVDGDGTSAYGGITGLVSGIGAAGVVTMSSGNTAFEDITLPNLNAVAALLPDKFHVGASWLMNRAAFADAIQRLLYAAGGNTAGNIADGSGAQLFGYPINFTEAMPAEAADKFALFFGDFRQALVLGDRTAIDVTSSEHYAFNEDVLTLKLISRYDLEFHRAGDGSDAGAVVGLKTAAS